MAYTTIDKSSDYFNTVTWSGNGSSQNITGVGFNPDFIWTKSRSGAYTHELFDKVRGATNRLRTDSDVAENAEPYQSFITDGFAWSSSGNQNINGDTYVSWNWLANGAGSSNTDGSITSTVSANTTSGFSIVKYTGNATSGATIGHGLGSAPKVMIHKQLNTLNNWIVWHSSLSSSNDYYLVLEATSAASNTSGSTVWNSTAPGSSVFTVGNNGVTNASGGSYIAYCFAEKKGFSKFGSYTGNGSTDGTFVYTGFKPAMVIYKNVSGIEGWMIQDNRRPGYNPMGGNLFPNNSNAESTDARFDFVSNGFKARSGNQNTNGATHIYMAFAEHPLVSSSGVPCTAR